VRYSSPLWPYQSDDDPIARTLNAAKAYVASRTLTTLHWNNPTAMAINQASFFLYPPRYGPTVKETEIKTVTGEPLRMIGSELVDADAPVVLNADVLSWFQRRGFAEKETCGRVTDIFRDREETFLGVQEVVELSIPLDEAELPRCTSDFFSRRRLPTGLPIGEI
jgi:hypothetical protein